MYRPPVLVAMSSRSWGIFTDRRDALNLDERVRRVRVVDAHHHTWITHERTAFGGVPAGVERQLAAVDDEPDRRDERSAVLREVTQLGRAGTRREEGDDVFGQLRHTSDCSCSTNFTVSCRSPESGCTSIVVTPASA